MFFSHMTTEHRAESRRARSRGQQCPQRSPQPPRGARTLPSPRHISTSPRQLLAKIAATTPRVQKERVANAFCLCVGSKSGEQKRFISDIMRCFEPFFPSSIHLAAIRRFPSQLIL